MKTALTCLLLVALALPSLSSAQSAVSVASPATMTASEVAARLAFVESRIAAETTYANIWWWGVGAMVGATAVGRGIGAATADNDDAYHFGLVEGIKAGISLSVHLALPMPARWAQSEVEAMPNGTDEEKAARLARAEELLRFAARRSRGKISWVSHVSNLVGNGASALVLIYALDHPPGPVLFTDGLSFVVMEITYFIYSQQPRRDVREYDARFNGGPKVTWNLTPTFGGAAFTLKF